MKSGIFPGAALFLSCALALCPLSGTAAWALNVETVYVAPMSGVVGVTMEEYVENVFGGIGGGENAILVFKMDTPGGLVDSMSRIMSLIAESEFPVAVWVAPSGARAASAGAFIVQAAHVAAMAPETNIGAAHPVAGNGEDIDDSEMDRKIMNDLLAKMRSFAQERERNAEVAERMVRDSVSLTAREAFEQYVIDFIAGDEKELLEKLNGREVKIKGGKTVISLDNYEIRTVDMGFRFRVLEVFSRPDIAYLALMAGIILIVLELRAPGGFVLGVTGGVLLLTAAYSLHVLPVNFAGAALLAGGLIVVLADIAVGGIGILAVPGFIAMLLGSLLIYRTPGGELLNVSAGFMLGVTLASGIVFFLILRAVCKTVRRKPPPGMTGERAKILEREGSSGDMVMLHGEYWRVTCDKAYGALAPGDEVEVIGMESMILVVKPVKKMEV
ncbi:MAG: nodulation protein NfeD [Synergistaceae bacterium]|jgi:membrane-bound serine protease (ClpP class)|nr:nodulation protein NfeD [Synergistaceae bacterium]